MWQRYPARKWLYDVVTIVKDYFFIALILFVVSRSDSMVFSSLRWLFLAFIVLVTLAKITTWLTFRYQLDGERIHLKRGLFTKQEQTIPRSRIQNVQRNTSFAHRITGLTSLLLEVVDGAEAEMKFDALTNKQAEAIERFVQGEQAAAPIVRDVLFTPTTSELVKASFTSLSFLLIIPLGLKVWQFTGDWRIETSWLQHTWVIALLSVLAIILAVGGGIAKIFFTYWGYTIDADATRIYIRRGVLSENRFTVEKQRIQAIEYKQSLLKRMLGLMGITLITTGDASLESKTIRELYPYLPTDKAQTLVSDLLPQYALAPPTKRLPKRALIVRLLRPSYMFVVLLIALRYFQPTYWYAAFGWLVLLTIVRLLDFYTTRYEVATMFQMQTGALEVSRLVYARAKLIEIEIKQSFWQRRFGLASIHITGRGAPVRHATLRDVTWQETQAFVAWYYERTEDVRRS